MTRTSIVFVIASILTTATAFAQQETGDIIGRALDGTGAVLPGVTVTISGPALLQPRVAVTGETGRYQFARVPIGIYDVRFQIPGFRSQVQEGIRITIGFTAEVNATMELSPLEETITLSGRSPVVDTRRTTTAATFTQEVLEDMPSARDPWVMLDRAPGIAIDRVNVGGNESGDQSLYISRAVTPRATTSGPSMAWTSPTCQPPTRHPCITTLT